VWDEPEAVLERVAGRWDGQGPSHGS
jgi:hypothetical protein